MRLSDVQVSALRDAARAPLRYSVAGWVSDRQFHGWSTSTVESLCSRGLLIGSGSGKRRTYEITESGREWLVAEGRA